MEMQIDSKSENELELLSQFDIIESKYLVHNFIGKGSYGMIYMHSISNLI